MGKLGAKTIEMVGGGPLDGKTWELAEDVNSFCCIAPMVSPDGDRSERFTFDVIRREDGKRVIDWRLRQFDGVVGS